MHDQDCRFLAAAHTALAIVERYGNLPGEPKAVSVGILTFLLLDLLKHHGKAA